jgi:hypothetical protein
MSNKTVVPAVVDVEEQPYNYYYYGSNESDFDEPPIIRNWAVAPAYCYSDSVSSVTSVTFGNTKNGLSDPKNAVCYCVTVLPNILRTIIESNKGEDISDNISFSSLLNIVEKTSVTSNTVTKTPKNGLSAPKNAVLGVTENITSVTSTVTDSEGEAPDPQFQPEINLEDAPDPIIKMVKGKLERVGFKATDLNFLFLASALGYTFWYDEITQEPKVDFGGVCLSNQPNFNLNVLQTTLHSALDRIMSIKTSYRLVDCWVKWAASLDVRNPFKDWIESTPHDWEGTPYLDEWSNSIIQDPDSGISDDTKNLFLKRHIVGTVGMHYTNTPNHPYAVMLIGNQGVGKGRKLHELFTGKPDGHATWARFDNTNFNPANKDCQKAAMTCAFYEIGEVENLRKVSQADLKAFISQQEHNHTNKFENHAFKIPRRASIWITGNFTECLVDSSGGRRYLPIKVAKTTWEYSKDFSINKVWADAKYLYDKKFRTYFDREDEILFDGYKAQFIVSRPTDIQFENSFQTDAPIEKWSYQTFPAICRYLGIDMGKANANHIKAALRKIAKNPTLDTTTKRFGDKTAKCILCPPPYISVSQINNSGVLGGQYENN